MHSNRSLYYYWIEPTGRRRPVVDLSMFFFFYFFTFFSLCEATRLLLLPVASAVGGVPLSSESCNWIPHHRPGSSAFWRPAVLSLRITLVHVPLLSFSLSRWIFSLLVVFLRLAIIPIRLAARSIPLFSFVSRPLHRVFFPSVSQSLSFCFARDARIASRWATPGYLNNWAGDSFVFGKRRGRAALPFSSVKSAAGASASKRVNIILNLGLRCHNRSGVPSNTPLQATNSFPDRSLLYCCPARSPSVPSRLVATVPYAYYTFSFYTEMI